MKRNITTILLVSSRPEDLAYLTSTLAGFVPGKFCLYSELDIDSAVRFMGHTPVDVIIFDISLSHYQAAFGRIKDVRSDLPIIVLSGKDDLALAAAAMHMGAQDYLVRGKDDSNTVQRSIHYAMEREHFEEALRRAYDELELKIEERTRSLKELNTMLRLEIAEHMRTAQELRMEHEFSRAILDTIDALIIVLDAHGNIKKVNRVFESRTGYHGQEVIGRSIGEMSAGLDSEEFGQDFFHRILHTDDASQYENVLLAKDGARYTLKWSSTSLFDTRGAVEYVILTGMDITEQRQMEILDRRRLQNLAHASRLSTMGEMATEIAHELNQPLAAIASYSDSCLRLLEDTAVDIGDVRDALREIERQALRSGQIIKHIRSFTKKDSLSIELVNLSKLVRGIVDLIRVEVRSHDVRLRLDLQGHLPMVRVNVILIEQVLLNLTRNAIDAMEGVMAEQRLLEISTYAADGFVHVMVDDSGPGVPPGADVFDAFFTTKPEGIGMGLAISQSIVQSYGGRIRVEENSAGGARFSFALPEAEDN